MKKFDHLTSLDAIDPLPSKLGEKVTCSKIEKTKYHMGHKLKPGFSIEDGKLSYIPPTPTIKPKRFEVIEVPVSIGRGVAGANANTNTASESSGVKKQRPDLSRDFEGDVVNFYEFGALFEPGIVPLLKSRADVGSRKLNNIVGSGAFLRTTPLFHPTAHTTLNAKAHFEKLDRTAKEGCPWDLIAKQFINFTPKELEDKAIVTLDSLTEIADSTVAVQRQEPDTDTLTIRVQKKKLNHGSVGNAIEFPNLKDRDEVHVEGEAVMSKQDAPSEQSQIDTAVDHLSRLDQRLLSGQVIVMEAVFDLLNFCPSLLAKCLSRKEVFQLSHRGAQALSMRFHTESDGHYDHAGREAACAELESSFEEIDQLGAARLCRLLQSIELEVGTPPSLIALVPSALRHMTDQRLARVLISRYWQDIPQRYMAVMVNERYDRFQSTRSGSALRRTPQVLVSTQHQNKR